MASTAPPWGWTQGKGWEQSGDSGMRNAQCWVDQLFGKDPGHEEMVFSKPATLLTHPQPL